VRGSTRWLLRAHVVLLLLLAVGGSVIAVNDLSDHTDEMDGFGVFIGVLVLVPALLLSITAYVGLLVGARHPRAGRVIAVVVGAIVTLAGLMLYGTVPGYAQVPVMALGLALVTSVLVPEGAGAR